MTAPLPDDIVSGAVTFLGSKPDVVAAVGADSEGIWLFQYKLWAVIEKSESTAVVISHDGGWAGPNLSNTLRFPRLMLDIYCDPIRDDGNNATDPGEVQRRANRVYQIIDRYLHRVGSGSQMWGDVRTVSCARLTEPIIYAVPDGDGLVRSQTSYAVCEG